MSTQYDHTGEFKILYLKALWPFTLTGSSIVLQDFFPKAFFQHFSIFNILSAPRKSSSYVFLLVPLLSFGSACKVLDTHSHQLNIFHQTRFQEMKNRNRKLEHRFLHRIQMNFNMLHKCTKFASNKIIVSSHYRENKLNPV